MSIEVISELNPKSDGFLGAEYYGIYKVVEMENGEIITVLGVFDVPGNDNRFNAYKYAKDVIQERAAVKWAEKKVIELGLQNGSENNER